MIEEILTVQEVADYLKVSRTTVWRWCQEGKLPAFKIGRGWRLRRAEVEAVMGERLGGIVREEQTSGNNVTMIE